MEINPYIARQRMLEQFDGVRLQREALPDAETAGCPGCPYFWTCPVPHRGEEVIAPAEVDRDGVVDQMGERVAFRPHDESDIGWTDRWIEEDVPPGDWDDRNDSDDGVDEPDADDGDDRKDPLIGSAESASAPAEGRAPRRSGRGRRRAPRRGLFRRR